VGTDVDDGELADTLSRHAADGGASIVLTMGASGSVLIQPGKAPVCVPALAVDPVDVTGAGDVFVGIFLAVFLNTADALTATRWAAVGASYSIAAIGVNTVTVTADLIATGLASLSSQPNS
jgi:ribokinase